MGFDNRLPSKDRCTGCSACRAICPRSAISMVADGEGFLYPEINPTACIGCGKCTKVCPSLNALPTRIPLGVYAAMSNDNDLRRNSSSGGVFPLLAKETLTRGGLVFGAAFDHSDWHVFHCSVDNGASLSELCGSKYVQSEMGAVLSEVAEALKSGREVLFSGTPCQIAGLRGFLASEGKTELSRLLLVDVVCHAVPSPLAWKKYLENRVNSEYNGQGKGGLGKIRRISSRRKNCGWKRFSLSLGFANNKEYLSVFSEDPFMRGFLAELCNRPSCHNCPSKALRSGSDITIADFWNVSERLPDMDDDLGTSLVLVNSKKGDVAFRAIMSNMKSRESDFAYACTTNPAIVRPTQPHRNRLRFFKDIYVTPFDLLVNRLLQPPLRIRVRTFIGRQLRRLGLRR